VRDGDEVTIDVDARRLDVELDDATIAERIAAYAPPPNPDRTGVLAKYAALVSSAAQGAVTNPARPAPAPAPSAAPEVGPVVAPEA
jgi:dihydroxy-acid dehydratase